jgi:hypothetical protein
MSRMRRHRLSERQADVALGITLVLACIGVFAATKWVVAFCAMLLSGAMF